MPSWDELEPRHAELVSIRAGEEGIWRDLARMLEEDGGDFDNAPGSSRQRADTYDSTPLYAKDDLVSGLFSEAINPADPWFTLSIDDKDLLKWGPVATFLFDFRDWMFGSLDPATSSFYLQAQPWFGGMVKYGTGFLSQEEILAERRIAERALPVVEGGGGMYVDQNANGEINEIHRKFSLTGRQAKQKFRAGAPPMRDDERAVFVHALYPNPNYVPGLLGPRGMPIASCYVSPDKRDFVREGGFNEMPIHAIQWSPRGSRPWAMGPGHKALADMGMLDEMQRSVLTAMQFEAEPMRLAHDDSVFSAADNKPGNVINGAMSDQGKPLVQTLQNGENLHLPLAAVQAAQNAVRTAFKFSLFQIKNRPQMTSAEFLGWKEETLRELAPYLVCLHRGLAGFVTRRATLMARMDDPRNPRMPAAPPELAGHNIKIGFVSPFAQAQKASKATAAMRLGQAVEALLPLDPEAGDNIVVDNLVQTIADGMTADPRHVRDPREVARRRQARAEQQQQTSQLERAAQGASIFADAAHAQQALSLSKARGKAA